MVTKYEFRGVGVGERKDMKHVNKKVVSPGYHLDPVQRFQIFITLWAETHIQPPPRVWGSRLTYFSELRIGF